MKIETPRHPGIRTVTLAFWLLVSIASAKDILVPANSWEQLREGISVSLMLRGHSVAVHLRNTSTTARQLTNQGNNLLFKLFYIDDYGTPVPLGSGPPETFGRLSGVVDLAPGKEVIGQAALSSDELALVKTHPVTCMIAISDPATGQNDSIQATPKMLTEESLK